MSKRKKRILIFSGVLGPKKQGNQSLKNTLKGFLSNGYDVFHFSLIAKRNASHNFQGLIENKQYHYFGFPDSFMIILTKFNRKQKIVDNQTDKVINLFPKPDDQVDLGITEINNKQILIAKIYSIFEIIRSLFFVIFLKPDFLYGYEIYGIKTASFFGRIFRIKVINRFQGTYITEKNMNWKPIRYHKKMMKSYCNGIVMANDGTKGDKILKVLGVPDDKIFFHVNGIDDRIFNYEKNYQNIISFRKEVNSFDRKYIFGIFNRFYPFKRIDRAIYIVKNLIDQGLDIQLIIGGSGGPLESDLKELVKNLKLNNYISFIGKIPFDKMTDAYNGCDVVLITNDYANTGNQVFETIYLGIPLIAVDDGNNSKLYGDCPYATFKTYNDIIDIKKEEVERLLNSKIEQYNSSNLIDWKSRMKREINWIENII